MGVGDDHRDEGGSEVNGGTMGDGRWAWAMAGRRPREERGVNRARQRARRRATAKGESEKEEGRSQLMDDQDGDDVARRTNKRRKKRDFSTSNEKS
jgi:hypothetical protein